VHRPVSVAHAVGGGVEAHLGAQAGSSNSTPWAVLPGSCWRCTPSPLPPPADSEPSESAPPLPGSLFALEPPVDAAAPPLSESCALALPLESAVSWDITAPPESDDMCSSDELDSSDGAPAVSPLAEVVPGSASASDAPLHAQSSDGVDRAVCGSHGYSLMASRRGLNEKRRMGQGFRNSYRIRFRAHASGQGGQRGYAAADLNTTTLRGRLGTALIVHVRTISPNL
jgi:hypothetical protein